MEPYSISSRDYLARARARLAQDTAADLFYAALEIRCGVEARLQEYLEPHKHIPVGKRTEWRVGNLHRTAETAFKLGDQVARVTIVDRVSKELLATLYYTPVSARLKQLAEKIGDYLHAAKTLRDPNDPYWQTFLSELREAIGLLEMATTGTLLGPVLVNRKTGLSTMPVESSSNDADTIGRLKGLKGRVVDLDFGYFPSLASARNGAS